ncbi:MAG: hypothetical protein AVDCRST_MAG73-1995 [uncultured Thermomicrobiales bacterium]|uniref:ABM domain-containing protein n=1 Tax=uncultured Thermomicrobiales bacterium TaxID=1645740 RepID=A0A6J4U8C2_9BACT|nr:MAG: hypothetical protein AVDCRST_MAG73-1995 [uncultured Thermomicrobiales bacterium]
MAFVLGRVPIGDLATFLGVFGTRGAGLRGQHGCTGSVIFRERDAENRLVVLLEWASPEAFDAFRNDPAVRDAMRASGTTAPAEFTLLDKIAEFPT